jgi:predicted ester cyclase
VTHPNTQEETMPRCFAVVTLVALTLTLGLTQSGLARQATPAPTNCPATTEEENIAIARVWHEDVINQRNQDALQDVLDPAVVHHAAGGYPEEMTIDEVSAMMGGFLDAFPDLKYEFDLWITQDDYVVERYTATGTQEGPLPNLPATGRTATWTGVNIFRIECGKIVEVWSEVDALSRNAQLTGAAEATPDGG